jgi:hypothetical protein
VAEETVIAFFMSTVMSVLDPLVIVAGVGLGLLVENKNDRLALAGLCLLFAFLIGLHSLLGLRSVHGLQLGTVVYNATTQTLGALLLAGLVVGIAMLVKRPK